MKTHPNFNDWIISQEGQKCLRWPVGDATYLKNRLFWAFQAGYNHTKSESGYNIAPLDTIGRRKYQKK